MDINHALAFVAGLLAAIVAVLPVGVILRRLLRDARRSLGDLQEKARSLQTGRDADAERLAVLAASLSDLHQRIETLGKERDGWARASASQEKAKAVWKERCEGVVKKHNDLVNRYNALV